jgi:hypothetical protein
MPTRITNLDTLEVSLVPKGANKKKFILFKSDKGEIEMQELLKNILEKKLENEDKIESICKDNGLSENAVNAIKGALRILLAAKDELPEEIFSMLAEMAGYEWNAPEPLPGPEMRLLDYISQFTKLLDLFAQKISQKGDNLNKILKDLSFTKEEIEKVNNKDFKNLNKDKFIKLAKTLEIKGDDILNVCLEEICKADKQEPSNEHGENEAKNIQPDFSLESISKMINEKNDLMKETILKKIQDQEIEIQSLKKEITKLNQLPIAPSGEGLNTTENITKIDKKKNFWAGVV